MFNPLQALQPNFVVGLLGGALGGPVGSILGNLLGGANLLQGLKGMLDGLSGLFGKAQGNAGNVSPRPLPFSCNNMDLKTALNPLGTLAQNASQMGQVLGQQAQAMMNVFFALGGCVPAGNAANNFGASGSVLGAGASNTGSTASAFVIAGTVGTAAGQAAAGAVAASNAGSTSSSSGTSSGSSISNEAAMVDKAGASIDKMMGEAEKLMASDKPSDQLKGQMMMQRAMRMFEMISKMLEQRSQAQAKAIQAIK